MLDMKVEKQNRILLYSWLPVGTSHKKYGDLEKINRNLTNLGLFFMVFFCYRTKSCVLGQNLA
jgi:hypothetical protein